MADPPAYVDVDADGKRSADTFDVALQGAAEQILGRPRSRREQHERFLAKARTDRVQAETATAEQRQAVRAAGDERLKVWLGTLSDEKQTEFLSGQTFEQLPESKQNHIHALLDDLTTEYGVEVELRSDTLDEQEDAEFEFPVAAEPMPWETRPEVEDDEEEPAYNDDEDELYEATFR